MTLRTMKLRIFSTLLELLKENQVVSNIIIVNKILQEQKSYDLAFFLLQQSGNVQNLTKDRLLPKIDGGFACLKQIQLECQDSTVQVNFYNLCAYLTDLKADKIMYKACPSDKCNKMVTDMSNGNFRCEKCQKEYPEFHWR